MTIMDKNTVKMSAIFERDVLERLEEATGVEIKTGKDIVVCVKAVLHKLDKIEQK